MSKKKPMPKKVKPRDVESYAYNSKSRNNLKRGAC